MSCKIILLTCLAFLLTCCQGKTTTIGEADVYKSIGGQIRTERLKQGISQQQLADEVGITQGSLSLIEDGLATPIHNKLLDIEAYLKMTVQLEGPHKTIQEYVNAKRQRQTD
ncbi:MAG: helix-turn-helix domain-containing protein [Aureispira sp.]